MNQRDLVKKFSEDIRESNQVTFPIAVDAFTNLWNYEFGSLDNLPEDADVLIAFKARELGLLE